MGGYLPERGEWDRQLPKSLEPGDCKARACALSLADSLRRIPEAGKVLACKVSFFPACSFAWGIQVLTTLKDFTVTREVGEFMASLVAESWGIERKRDFFSLDCSYLDKILMACNWPAGAAGGGVWGPEQAGLIASAGSSFPNWEAGRSYESGLVHKACVNPWNSLLCSPSLFSFQYFGPVSDGEWKDRLCTETHQFDSNSSLGCCVEQLTLQNVQEPSQLLRAKPTQSHTQCPFRFLFLGTWHKGVGRSLWRYLCWPALGSAWRTWSRWAAARSGENRIRKRREGKRTRNSLVRDSSSLAL